MKPNVFCVHLITALQSVLCRTSLLSQTCLLLIVVLPTRSHRKSLNATTGLIIDNIMNALWKTPKDARDIFNLLDKSYQSYWERAQGNVVKVKSGYMRSLQNTNDKSSDIYTNMILRYECPLDMK